MQLPLIGKVTKPAPWVLGLVAAGLLGISATSAYFIVSRATSKPDIASLTVPVQSKDLTVRITANGSVVPVQNVNLSPKNPGLLVELYVEQGDRVEQGQVVARMDDADIQAQLVQAKGSLAQAQASLAEAQAGSRPEEVAQARSRLAQAQASLAEVRAGGRLEEVAQARAQVESAQARVGLTSERVNRYRYLARQGAESRDRLDEAVTDDRSARASLREAQQKLNQSQRGRPEEIARVEAEVAEAQQALRQLQNGSRPEEIAQAQAEVTAARGELQGIEVQQRDTLIRAPFSGIVTQKYATKGAFVAPTTSASSTSSATSTSIIAVAKGLEVLAEVPEVDVGRIRQGQSVEIVADAYPDQVYQGRVRRIAPEAVVEQNVTSFQVRVDIETGKDKLRSGMNVDVTFLGEGLSDVLVVPTVAIATQKGQTGVFVPNQENKPQFRPVTIGTTIQDQTQVLKGLKAGEQVFTEFPEGEKPPGEPADQ
jgi:HlyD family secretion protein